MNAPVCLITPPSTFLMDERVFVSLGILRVAACLERDGVPVEHVDLSGIVNFEDAMRDHASRSEAHVFGLTATTPQMPATTRVVSVLRDARPDARIILGGPHVTLVNAARKREVKLGTPGRAQRALDRLAGAFDVLVAGDGDDAIFGAIAPDAPQLIDADDPKSSLFLTDQRYEELPFPARHLVDMESYHYTIDGVRAHSMIAQLGCLAAGTKIARADSRSAPIETLRKGDWVICFDDLQGRFAPAPIVNIWERDADDLWRLTIDDQTTLLVTSEHPIWTRQGWQKVADIRPGIEVACVPGMRETHSGEAVSIGDEEVLQHGMPEKTRHSEMPSMSGIFHGRSCSCASSQVLRESLPEGMDAVELQSGVAAIRTTSHEGEVGCDDACCTDTIFEHRKAEGCSIYAARSKDIFRDETRGCKSHEATGGSTESLGYSQTEMGRHHLGEKKARLEGRPNVLSVGEGYERSTPQLAGAHAVHNLERSRAAVPIRGGSRILDRPMCIREASQSRLHRQKTQDGHPTARRALPFDGVGDCRGAGLHREGLARPHDLVQRTAGETATLPTRQNPSIRFQRVISKRFIGHSRVYNITVCPGHSYIANGIVVHNCPYECGFCGGRESSMLRRIRTRTTASVIAEIRDLYETFGVTGIMMYDDELNVNKECVGLMNAIAELGKNLGVEFRLRGFIKSNLFTDEQAEAMYRAGFRWILIGFESGSPRILQNINKKATREQNNECMAIARRHGLKVKALMSIGHPGESEETVQQTRDWLLEQRPDDFDCTVISCYPGTPYYDHAAQAGPDVWTYIYPKNGDRLHAYDVDYSVISDAYKGIPGEYRSYVFTDHLTADDLVRMRDALEDDVRRILGIPFNAGAPGVRYEASMGQLPAHILRNSRGAVCA